MRVVLVSDIHVHNWREFSVPLKRKGVRPEGVPSRLWHGVSVWYKILNHCRRHNVKHVLFGGDLFHRRDVIATEAFNLVVAALASFRAEGVTVYGIPGNHDQATRSGDTHALEALALTGLIQTGTHYELGHDTSVIGIPYQETSEGFARAIDKGLSQSHSSTKPIGLFHQGFDGCRVGSHLEHVVKSEIVPTREQEFLRMFSGHYHAIQQFGESGTYIGSPMHLVRGEPQRRKGFLDYDTATNAYTLVDLGFPRFITVSAAKYVKYAAAGKLHNNYVDVVVDNLETLPTDTGGALARRPVLRSSVKEVARHDALVLGQSHEALIDKYTDDDDNRALGRTILSEAMGAM